MGRFLTGDAGYQHEGYPAYVLDDGTLTGTHGPETRPRMIGQVVAACGCGWTGTTHYPTDREFDEAAEQLALAEWEHAHARPVLAAAQHADLGRLQAQLQHLATRNLTAAEHSPRELADQLARVVRALETATELARRLHNQAFEQAEQQ